MSVKRSQPNNDADAPPKNRRAGCVWACIGLFLILFLCGGGWFCLFVDIPLEISKETTYITEPLTADGKKVDYFAALELEYYPEDMKTDDNGYRLIVKNLGDLADYSDEGGHPLQGVDLAECRAQTLEKLGLDSSDIRQPALKFQSPYDFLKEYFAGEEFDAALVKKLLSQEASEEEHYDNEMEDLSPLDLNDKLRLPWTPNDLPMMARWLEENGPALDLISRAVRAPSFRIPLVRREETRPLALSLSIEDWLILNFARALQARACHRIAVGNIDGAIDDILACKRAGGHVGREFVSWVGWVGLGAEGMAGSVGVAASLEHQPSEAQLQRLFDEWEGIAPARISQQPCLADRHLSLEFVQGMAQGDYSLEDLFEDVPDLYKSSPELAIGLGVDWNLVAKRVNEYYDRLEANKQGIQADPDRGTPKALLSKHRARAIAKMVGLRITSSSGACLEANHRMECSDNLHRIALAMLIYERQHETLPPAYTVDTEGAVLHSWRVLLLPYLGQQELYDKIRLDEPWDSQHNRQFHEQAVAFYQCPTAALAPGQTTYSVVVGSDMPFEAGQGKSLADFGSQSGDMILVVERAGPVCWMNPTQEVPQAVAERGINGSSNGIASGHPGGAQFGHRDGAVRFLSETLDVETLKKLLNGTNDSSIY